MTDEPLGAVPHDHGTTFRVWAPHASAVGVEGDFNQWGLTPMERDDAGVWSADIDGAGHGDEYRYVLRAGDRELHRIDPRAQHVTNSVGHGIVHDHSLFDWAGTSTTCPGSRTS
uniref:CBM_48 n=1 Tax=uncultured Intrasporangium sp. TaxID=332040 RepID=A0A060C9V0_9MICO|nr:CBM_48 [uncultured Intrasporangium sp.]